MTLKNLLGAAAAAAMIASPALAQTTTGNEAGPNGPVISIDLLRIAAGNPGAGNPVIDPDTGGLTYVVFITPDTDQPVFNGGAGPNGEGAAIGLELGFIVGGAGLDTRPLSTAGVIERDDLPVAANDPVVVNADDTPGMGTSLTDIGTIEFANPGNQIFAFQTGNENLDTTGDGSGDSFGGIQINAATNQVFAALGTTFFAEDNTGDVGGPFEILRIKTGALDSDIPASLQPSLTLVADSIAAQSTDFSGGQTSSQSFLLAETTDSDQIEIGDANLDGDVNFLDFGALSGNFNSTTGNWSLGDFNADGLVNFLDFGALSGNFNASGTAPAVASATVVPEPSSLFLLMSLAGGIACLKQR